MGMDEIWSENEELKSENEDLKATLQELLPKIAEMKNIAQKANEVLQENIALREEKVHFQKELDELKSNYTKLQNKMLNKQNEGGITQWEYKLINTYNNLNDEEFNKLGKDGWEMTGQTASPGGGTNTAIFKRPKKPQTNKESHYGYSR